MARFSQPRSAFGPEALAQLTPIFDDVWKELVSEDVLETSTFDEESTRIDIRLYRLDRNTDEAASPSYVS
jgi:hypothetical protein